eukprot:gb/GEZN01000228.1/.p1 GENE.gb/GEZN01000228.1/~~gb/GEZN01000228.1/.p1  ORF type:complete len:1671 (-),score=192.82 gb/GEZN01000228.1/:468-5264(-)
MRRDEIPLLPAHTSFVDVQPDINGQWKVLCDIKDHIQAGMVATINVAGPSEPFNFSGVMHEHFITAEEVLWDYAPDQTTSTRSGKWIDGSRTDRIGSIYKKAHYVEYTDATYTTPKTRPAEWVHLGLLGPLLRAQVGDVLRVHFKNLASFPYSIHAHGMAVQNNNSGVDLGGISENMRDDSQAVLPGGSRLYEWYVPERSGPGPQDPNSVVWVYHSAVDPTQDTNAGLIGPIIITRRGTPLSTKDPGRPLNLNREFVFLFSVSDENAATRYIDVNTKLFTSVESPEDLMRDPGFRESNLMHGINFRVFDNLDGLEAQVGDRVRVYLMGLGGLEDIHSIHAHGMTGVVTHKRADVLDILPAVFMSIDLLPDEAGYWMFHCHVNDHITAGMMSHFLFHGVCKIHVPFQDVQDKLFEQALDSNLQETLLGTLLPICQDPVLARELMSVDRDIYEAERTENPWKAGYYQAYAAGTSWISDPPLSSQEIDAGAQLQNVTLNSIASRKLRELVAKYGLESNVVQVRVLDILGATVGLAYPSAQFGFKKDRGYTQSFDNCNGGIWISAPYYGVSGVMIIDYYFPMLGEINGESNVVGVIIWTLSMQQLAASAVCQQPMLRSRQELLRTAYQMEGVDYSTKANVFELMKLTVQDFVLAQAAITENEKSLPMTDIKVRDSVWSGGGGQVFRENVDSSNASAALRQLMSQQPRLLSLTSMALRNNQGVLVASSHPQAAPSTHNVILPYYNGRDKLFLDAYRSCAGSLSYVGKALNSKMRVVGNLELAYPILTAHDEVVGVLEMLLDASVTASQPCPSDPITNSSLSSAFLALQDVPVSLQLVFLYELLPLSFNDAVLSAALKSARAGRSNLQEVAELEWKWSEWFSANNAGLSDSLPSATWDIFDKAATLQLADFLGKVNQQGWTKSATKESPLLTQDIISADLSKLDPSELARLAGAVKQPGAPSFLFRIELLDTQGALVATSDLRSESYYQGLTSEYLEAFKDCHGGVHSVTATWSELQVGKEAVKEEVKGWKVSLPVADEIGTLTGVLVWWLTDLPTYQSIEILDISISSGLAVGLQTTAGVLMACVVALLCIVFRYRDHPILKISSVLFRYIMLFGISVILCSVFAVAAPPSKVSCAAYLWLLQLGFAIAFGSLFLVIFRIYQIMSQAHRRKFAKARIPNSHLFLASAINVTINALFLGIWQLTDAPYVTTVVYANMRYDVCIYSSTGTFTYILVFLDFCALLVAVVVACRLQRVILPQYKSASDVNEVAHASFNTVALCFIFLPCLALLQGNVQLHVAALALFSITLAMNLCVCIFARRLIILIRFPKPEEYLAGHKEHAHTTSHKDSETMGHVLPEKFHHMTDQDLLEFVQSSDATELVQLLKGNYHEKEREGHVGQTITASPTAATKKSKLGLLPTSVSSNKGSTKEASGGASQMDQMDSDVEDNLQLEFVLSSKVEGDATAIAEVNKAGKALPRDSTTFHPDPESKRLASSTPSSRASSRRGSELQQHRRSKSGIPSFPETTYISNSEKKRLRGSRSSSPEGGLLRKVPQVQTTLPQLQVDRSESEHPSESDPEDVHNAGPETHVEEGEVNFQEDDVTVV